MSLEKDIKQSKFDNPYEKVVVNIIYTAKMLEGEVKEILQEFGITSPQYNILRILNGAYPKPITPGDIKEVMLSKGSDLTRLLDRLDSKSFVSRVICPSNRRQIEILITDKGKKTLQDIQGPLDKMINKWGKNISLNTAKSLNQQLDQFRASQ